MEEQNAGGKERPGKEGPGVGAEQKGGTGRDRWSDNELLYEFGFSTFILSLSTSALVHLGELPDPLTSKKEVNLQLAKQTISIIEMLKDKTKGNLTSEEESLIDSVLYDIRLKYVQAIPK
jgi:hypothetical protein